MKGAKCIFLTLVICSFNLNSWAQAAWTLEDCIHHGIENNIQLKKEELKLATKSHQVRESKFRLLPSLNLRSAYTNRFGRSVDPLTYQFTTEDTRGAAISAYTETPVFQGFQGINSLRKSKIDLEKNLAEYEQARQDLSMNITRDFFQILFYQELRNVAEKEVEIIRQQLEKTQRLVDAGSLTKGDYLEIEALLALEEVNLVNVQNDLELSKLNLALLLELDDSETFNIIGLSNAVMPLIFNLPEPDSIYAEAQSVIPAIKATKLGIESAQKNLMIARGALSPDIRLNSGWGTGYSNQIKDLSSGMTMPFNEQLGFASTTYLGFSINIPIFNGLRSYTAVKDARLAVMDSQFDHEIAQKQLKKEIQLAYADARAAYQKFLATEKSVSSLQLAFDNVTRKYNLGMLTSFEYNSAMGHLNAAQSELLQAKYNYLFNIKILNFYRDLN